MPGRSARAGKDALARFAWRSHICCSYITPAFRMLFTWILRNVVTPLIIGLAYISFQPVYTCQLHSHSCCNVIYT